MTLVAHVNVPLKLGLVLGRNPRPKPRDQFVMIWMGFFQLSDLGVELLPNRAAARY
jgi:hypothetical protein